MMQLDNLKKKKLPQNGSTQKVQISPYHGIKISKKTAEFNREVIVELVPGRDQLGEDNGVQIWQHHAHSATAVLLLSD